MSSSSTREVRPSRARSAAIWAYLLIALAALGIVALVLPWFRPTIGGHAVAGEATTHSWNGLLFFLAPVLMSYVGYVAYRAAAPRRASGLAVIAGALWLITAIVSWVRVPANYADWTAAQDYARSAGLTLGRGPLIGFWLSIAVAVLSLVVGGYGLVRFPAASADESDRPARTAGSGRSPIEPIADLESFAPPRRPGAGRHAADL